MRRIYAADILKIHVLLIDIIRDSYELTTQISSDIKGAIRCTWSYLQFNGLINYII